MRQWSLTEVNSNDAMGTASYHIELSHEFKERLTLCYMILRYVPASGLGELKEVIGSIIEFYRDIDQDSEFKLTSPSTTSYEVTYNEPVVRDVFSIGED